MLKIDFLKDITLFEGLDELDLEQIVPFFVKKEYKKDSYIFFEGDLGEELYIIESGGVKIKRFNDNKEFILAIFREEDYFGEMAIIQPGQVRSATAQTIETTTLYALHRKQFENILENIPKLSIKLLYSALDRLRKANDKIEDLTFLDAKSRLYKAIWNLAHDFGISKQDGILIDFKLTHQQLADMIGSVRETVSVFLSELQNEGILSIDKKKIMIRDLSFFEKELLSV